MIVKVFMVIHIYYSLVYLVLFIFKLFVADDNFAVVPPSECVNISDEAKIIAKVWANIREPFLLKPSLGYQIYLVLSYLLLRIDLVPLNY